MSAKLFEVGAEVIELPTIRIEAPLEREEFSRLVTDVHTYDWPPQAPMGWSFFDAFFAAYEDARSFGKPKIAAIGPATARKIAEYRFTTDLPRNFRGRGFVEAFKNQHIESQTVLWVKAEDTREIIYDKLMNRERLWIVVLPTGMFLRPGILPERLRALQQVVLM